MAFQFSLQAVLVFRQSVERQEELRLLAANQQVIRLRRLIEQLTDRMISIQSREAAHLTSGITAAEMHFHQACQSALEQQRQIVVTELQKVEKLRDQQRAIHQRARRERETLELLRDRDFREYHRLAIRKEQRRTDDLFLLRQTFRSSRTGR